MKTKRLRAKPIIYSICLLHVLRHIQVKKVYLLIILASHVMLTVTLSRFLAFFPTDFRGKERLLALSSFNLTFGLKPQVGGIKIVTV